nr:F-box domain, leucine-rich repeat domain, L domain-like protein [Tanacetum cinerariifolium]
KDITDTRGPVPIQFELHDKQTVMPLGDHAAHWSSNIGEVIRGVPLYYPSWLKVPKERKAALITDIVAKSTIISQKGSRSLARLRDEMTSTTQEYLSLIDTFFVAHTVNGEFLRDVDRRIYEEMRRLEAMGTYTDDEINRLARGGKQRGHIAGVGRLLPARATASPSTPAHDSMLDSLYKKVDFMMSIFKSDSKYSDMFLQFESGGASRSGGCGHEEEGADHQVDEDKDGDGDA